VAAAPAGPSEPFLEALGDDLNTPKASAELFSLARRLETGGPDERALAKGQLLACGALIGFLRTDPEAWFQGDADPELKARVEDLIARRAAARADRDFALADKLRANLADLDVEVMDTPTGATWKRREGA
jgi:cysteinyl-tRNA synthetase